MSTKFYKTKASALKKKEEGFILANRNTFHYFCIPSYSSFLDLIKSSDPKDFYEFIPAKSPVCFFFDIEVYRDTSTFFENCNELVTVCCNAVTGLVRETYPNASLQNIVLESHSEAKKSFHVLVRAFNDNREIMFENVDALKKLYKAFGLDKYRDSNNKHLIDPSVYREGLFRTLYSSKAKENRPIVKSYLSDDFEEVETFVCNHSGEFETFESEINEINEINEIEVVDLTTVPKEFIEADIKTIEKFVCKHFHHLPNKVREIIVDTTLNCIVVALTERYCPFLEREHKSNFQYVVIDTTSAKQKCHDSECNEKRHGDLPLEDYPIEVHDIIKRYLRVNQQELELIDRAAQECKNYITENFDKDISKVSFDHNEMVFRGNVSDDSLAMVLKGTCQQCKIEHQISNTGYCIKCIVCKSIFPRQQMIPIDQKYKTLNAFWSNYQVTNINNQVINIYNTTCDAEFSCDIQLDNNIFRNKEITTLVNQILDGHKIIMISKLLHTIHKNYVYSNNNWYFFDGFVWKLDKDNLKMKEDIIELQKLFERIRKYYETKQSTSQNVPNDITASLNKNIKSLVGKFYKPNFLEDVIKGAKIYYHDEYFTSNLNSKKHLIPFKNGVFDLLTNKFRKTKKEDFINLTTSFDYNDTVHNQEAYTFLQQVLPNEGVRNYVLKKMSECLNGDIPNTNFLMFIGDGANGKSQLLNLMKLVMGELGEKVEVTLLTRKRNNANEANTEKIKLMNKRFAFLSEPEDGEKINIGLLKELTGSEEIVARGLYQDAMSFVMEAKLFLACNELPEIKGEDTALWRRIRVIDFPSRFVDEPKESNEYAIDRTLPSRMREDISWRQTLMNVLISFYYKTVTEPVEVKFKTNEYRQENNDFYNWLEENIEYKENDILKLKDVVDMFVGREVKKEREKSKYKKEIEKFIKDKYKNVKHEYGKVRFASTNVDEVSHNPSTAYGWKHMTMKEN